MKRASYILILIITLSTFCLTACSGSTPSHIETAETTSEDTPYNIVSQKAYERGYAAGCSIIEQAEGSMEREKALLEVHSIVSALERNGFRQSAKDFSYGVQVALTQ